MKKEFNHEEICEMRSLIGKNFAQIPFPENRFYDEREVGHLGNHFEDYSIRNEFTRDSDRIIYSKAFRRLEHKAQVYSNKRGDHYRTRLTHTLEVTQIAKSISRNLGINVDLTEAIALGHDIGHTPFGHAGEDVLDNIMRGNDDLGGKLEFSIDYGGFKHNFNCLKILEIVEKKYGSKGLNLTWQTLDGILKHTSVIKKDKKWDLSRFVRGISNYDDIITYNYFDDEFEIKYEFPLTLEGQVVAISDEIAQREHDLDDSLRDGGLFRFEEMYQKIKDMLAVIKGGLNPKMRGYGLFTTFYDKIIELGKIENSTQWKELTSIIISYFIVDVTENTMWNINNYENFEDIIILKFNNKYVTKSLVQFSEIAKLVNNQIEIFVEKRIINSFNVNRFDGKGKFILKQLFKAYYENPRQMPRKQLMILVKNIQRTIKRYPQLKEEFVDFPIDLKELFIIDENYVDLENLQPMLDILKLEKPVDILKLENYTESSENVELNFEVSELLDTILNVVNMDIHDEYKRNYDLEKIIHNFFENVFIFCNSKTDDEIRNLDCNNCNKLLLLIKGWNELHYVYLSTICDYISQMTDDYAIREYHELYLE